MSDQFRDVFPYLITPVKEDGDLNRDAFHRQAREYERKGAHGILAIMVSS